MLFHGRNHTLIQAGYQSCGCTSVPTFSRHKKVVIRQRTKRIKFLSTDVQVRPPTDAKCCRSDKQLFRYCRSLSSPLQLGEGNEDEGIVCVFIHLFPRIRNHSELRRRIIGFIPWSHYLWLLVWYFSSVYKHSAEMERNKISMQDPYWLMEVKSMGDYEVWNIWDLALDFPKHC